MSDELPDPLKDALERADYLQDRANMILRGIRLGDYGDIYEADFRKMVYASACANTATAIYTQIATKMAHEQYKRLYQGGWE